MNIAFYHSNGIIATTGGISRITHTLVNLFRGMGHNVWLMGFKNYEPNHTYDAKQAFLPDQDTLCAQRNIEFFVDFVKQHNIEVVINQSGANIESIKYLSAVKEQTGVKIFSCLHNSILTPVLNFAYQKEFSLKDRGLDIIFHVLKLKQVKELIKNVYIRKNSSKYRNLCDVSDKVVVLCDGLKDELLEMAGSIEPDKIAVIPNVVPEVEPSTDAKSNTVLWVGTVDTSVKRLDFMLKAWQKISPEIDGWQLKILGDGPALAKLKTWAKDHGLKRVSFEGRVSPQSFYESARIICVTSAHESFSLVTVEAMRHGVVPIVFNSFPAAKMIIETGTNGLLIEPFSVDILADAIKSLTSNRPLLESLSAKAVESAHAFDSAVIYKIWENILAN